MSGEFDFINWIRQQQPATARLLVPPGDDLAALRWDADDLLLVGVDQVLDGVHFDSATHAPDAIGRKVMNRNLSDCAAMACLPVAAVVSVALPTDAGLDYARQLYKGLADAGAAFDCPIVGGDTGSWAGKLVLSVTIIGRSAGVEPVTRHGAGPDQTIYVTGPLGGSILGRHMTFTPRVHEARKLAASGRVTAMIDLSDGLSRDLGHICAQSHVGAILDPAAIPVHDDAVKLSARSGWRAVEHALHDGEDHELLFAFDGELPPDLPGIKIGTTTTDPAIRLRAGERDIPLEPRGWEHRL